MNISGKLTDAQFRNIVLDSWRLGLMERDLRAADLVREIKRRLLAELQANAEAAASADGRDDADGPGAPASDEVRSAAGSPEAAPTAVETAGGPAAQGSAGAAAERVGPAAAPTGAEPADRSAGPAGRRPAAGRRPG